MSLRSVEEQTRYFKGLSGLALAQLSAGLFFTISVVGVYVSLISFVECPWWVTLFWAGFTGCFALLYFFSSIRSLRLLPVVIALQISATICAGRYIVARPLPHTALGHTVLIEATAMLGCSLVGYAIFFAFIKSSGISLIRIQTELALAHRLQTTLVPAISAESEHFEIFGATRPSEKVGGDLVDFVRAPGSTIAYVADVSGHGIPAGVLMGMLKASIRTVLRDNWSLGSMLTAINTVLPAVKEPTMYATLACVRLDEATGAAEYAIAGHPPILHYRAADGEVIRLENGGPPVGLLPHAGFPSEKVELGRGDLMILFSDGCVEVPNAGDEEYGVYRLEYAVVHCANDPLPVLYDTVLEEIRVFGQQTDDQSLLLIRRR
jgi:hypothetical protein